MTNSEARIIINKLAQANCDDKTVLKALIKASLALEIMSEIGE